MNAPDHDTANGKLDRTERRQQIFQRTVAKYAARGIRIEDDAEYMALIRLWISGELEMREAAALYDDIRKRRGHHRTAIAHPVNPSQPPVPEKVTGMTQEELIEELAKLSERL